LNSLSSSLPLQKVLETILFTYLSLTFLDVVRVSNLGDGVLTAILDLLSLTHHLCTSFLCSFCCISHLPRGYSIMLRIHAEMSVWTKHALPSEPNVHYLPLFLLLVTITCALFRLCGPYLIERFQSPNIWLLKWYTHNLFFAKQFAHSFASSHRLYRPCRYLVTLTRLFSWWCVKQPATALVREDAMVIW